MHIVFKNGEKVEIDIQVAEVIFTNLATGKELKWQSFVNGDNKIFLVVNMEEVAFIN